MRLIRFVSAVSLLIAVGGCSVDDSGSPRLSLGDGSGYPVAVGSAAYNDAYMNPYDPSDQQQNQGHGLGFGSGDPEYYSQFLRF
jgi:hypothetical protein